MTTKLKLTKTTVETLKPVPGRQVVFWDRDLTGFGVRVSPRGSKAFFYQGRLNGREKKLPIGSFGKVTADAARKEAARIQSMMVLGRDPAREKAKGQGKAFGDLMTGYCDLLEQQGKESANSVRKTVTRHIQKAHPRLWKKLATAITLEDCVSIVGKIVDAGHANMANKVRTYIRTAYSEAINARGSANVPESMRGLGVRSNPASEMRVVEGANNAKERALSIKEFRAYWRHLRDLPEPKRSIGMLHVLTGGQRQRQLARVTFEDVDRDSLTMTIYDIKGKRKKPRRHVIPLLPKALELIEGITAGPYVFSCNGGDSPVFETYIGDIAKDVCAIMKAAKELEGEPFTGGTIRATVETRLAAKPYRVSSDVLAQLLSHGLGGVQQRHYQHHDFFEEKLEALQKLQRLLEGTAEPAAEVVQLDARRAAR